MLNCKEWPTGDVYPFMREIKLTQKKKKKKGCGVLQIDVYFQLIHILESLRNTSRKLSGFFTYRVIF